MIIKELFAKLGLDIDKGGFTTADVLLAGVKAGLVALGGLAVAAAGGLGVLVHDLVETSGSLNDTSQAIGVDVEALQELAFAAKLGGVAIEEMQTGLTILSRHLIAAKEGSEESQKAFSRLGLSIRDHNGQIKTADQVLEDVAAKFEKMPDGPKKTAAAMDLFGRSGAQLIPVLNEGRAGLEKLRQEARDLGVVIDRDTIKAGDDLGDNLDRLKLALKGVGYQIAGPLLAGNNEMVLSIIAWIKANRQLIATRIDRVIKLIIAAGKILVRVLEQMWRVLGFVIDNWRLFAVILGSIALAAILRNAGAIALLVVQYARMGAAALAAGIRTAAAWIAAAAPMVLLTAIIALAILLIDELITKEEGGLTLIGELGPKLQKFLQDFANGGKNDEPAWIGFLRYGALLLTDFSKTVRESVEGWKLIFAELGKWIIDQFARAFDYVAGKIKATLDSVRGLLKFSPTSGAAPGFGGGATPLASVAGSPGGGRSVVQQNRNEFTIVQQPGQDGRAVADNVRATLDNWHQDRLEEAASALGVG